MAAATEFAGLRNQQSGIGGLMRTMTRQAIVHRWMLDRLGNQSGDILVALETQWRSFGTQVGFPRAGMRVMTGRTILFLGGFMCHHARYVFGLMATATRGSRLFFQQRHLFAGMRNVAVETGCACCLKVFRLGKLVFRVTPQAELLTGFLEQMLVGASVRIMARLTLALGDRCVFALRRGELGCGHVFMAGLA